MFCQLTEECVCKCCICDPEIWVWECGCEAPNPLSNVWVDSPRKRGKKHFVTTLIYPYVFQCIFLGSTRLNPIGGRQWYAIVNTMLDHPTQHNTSNHCNYIPFGHFLHRNPKVYGLFNTSVSFCWVVFECTMTIRLTHPPTLSLNSIILWSLVLTRLTITWSFYMKLDVLEDKIAYQIDGCP